MENVASLADIPKIWDMVLAHFRQFSLNSAELLDFPLKGKFPPRIDLSVQNISNTGARPFEFEQLSTFIEGRKQQGQSPLVWGGYLEQRLIYSASSLFHQAKYPRNIHLGLDFWTVAGCRVFAPLAGTIHSFQDNANFRDYGPTIILRHEIDGFVFHSLYGHLSRASLTSRRIGEPIAQGDQLGEIGQATENGEWPPHLHFQLILDMQGKQGDYPGVCSLEELKFYRQNCPDPRFLLGI